MKEGSVGKCSSLLLIFLNMVFLRALSYSTCLSIFCKSLAYVQLSFDLSSKLMFTLTELMYMVSGAIMSEKERVCVHKHHESL